MEYLKKIFLGKKVPFYISLGCALMILVSSILYATYFFAAEREYMKDFVSWLVPFIPSIGVLVFLGLTFLLTGDAPKEIENKIINTYDLDIDVLKVGHHGSNTSTSNKFIESIKPEVAIISCGKNNIYGHPHSEVINALIYNKVVIFRTDYDGSIKISKNILNELIIYTKL